MVDAVARQSRELEGASERPLPGGGKRILSCSLFQAPTDIYWREDKTPDRMSAYIRFMPALVRAFHALWSGWELRIHHDDAVREHRYFPALQKMHDKGLIRLVPCGPAKALCLAMLWRLKPAFEPEDHLVLTQDLDSLPLLLLRRMAMEFEGTGKSVMLVHACESHDGVMGGGIGVRGLRFRSLIRASSWNEFLGLAGRMDWTRYSNDEDYQRRTIWPMVRHDAVLFRTKDPAPTIPVDDMRREPVVGPPPGLHPDALARGDDFALYIGSAGYLHHQAFAFYAGLPLPAMASIEECEAGIDVLRILYP